MHYNDNLFALASFKLQNLCNNLRHIVYSIARDQSFTSLMANLRQDKSGVCSFSRRLNGTYA